MIEGSRVEGRGSRAATSGPLTASCLLLTIACLAGCNRSPAQHDGASFGVSPDGKSIAWTTGAGSNNILRVQRDGKVVDVSKGTYHEGPTFTPDAKTVVVAVGANFRSRLEIASVDVATGKRTTLIRADDRSNSMPALSPDGAWLAFVRAAKPKSQSMGGVQWGEFDVYLSKPDGTNAVALTAVKFARATAPRWSSDSKRLVFSALDREGRWWTQEIDVADRRVVRKIEGKNNESMPTYVGDRIAIVSDREKAGRYRIGFVDSAGTFEPIVPEEGYYLDLQESQGKLYALEDVTHKMRFRISEIDPKTGAIREVVPESQFDEKPTK